MNIKDLVSTTTYKQFAELSGNDKNILSSLSLYALLHQPYYKDTYTGSSVIISQKGDGFFLNNRCNDTGMYDTERSIHSFYELDGSEYNYPFEEWLEEDNEVRHFLVDNSIVDIVNRFRHCIETSNSNEEYVKFLVDEQKNNPNFIPAVLSFHYLISDEPVYNSSFFHKDIMHPFKEYPEFCTIKSSAFKSSDLLYSTYNEPPEKQKSWLDIKQELLNCLDTCSVKMKSIDEYIKENSMEDKIEKITQTINEQKSFLKDIPSSDNIDFYYYEIQEADKNSHFPRLKLENNSDFIFNTDRLERHGIKVAPFYENIQQKIDVNTASYEKETIVQNELENFLFGYNNDLRCLNGSFYGIPFLREGNKCSSDKQHFIIAKKNDDVIGYASFASHGNSDIVKCMNYVVVKETYRNLGIATAFYEKSIALFEGECILTNSSYTEQSRKILLEIKKQLKLKHDLLILEREELYGEKDASFTKELNDRFITCVVRMEKREPELVKKNLDFIVNHYKKIVEGYNGNAYDYYHYISDNLEQLNVYIENKELHRIFEKDNKSTNEHIKKARI